MPENSPPKVVRHEDFENVYDLPDPRTYYRALEPLDYRAPAIVSGYLKTHASRIAEQRGKARLSVLDFCSGYGANGALLNHALTLKELFAHYSADADGEAASQDKAFFASRRIEGPPFEIAGLDIAAAALDYARRCDLIDQGYEVNLIEEPVGGALAEFLTRCDVVVESGGIGAILFSCYQRLLDHLSGPGRPWFLACPRPDWDHGALWDLFREKGYVVEQVSELIPYRRTMAGEHEDAMARSRQHGHDPALHFRDGYYLFPLTLARPREAAEALPVERLLYRPD